MEAINKSTTTTYEPSDSEYIMNFFNIPKLNTTMLTNHNNQLFGQTSPSLSGISENSNENFDGGGVNNIFKINKSNNNKCNNNNNNKNIQINSNSSSSSDIDDPDDDSEQELTNLTWLTELRNQSLTWPESIKPIFDDDDDDDNDNDNVYFDDKDNNNNTNNNRDKNSLNNLTSNTTNSLIKLKVNGQNKLNSVLNNCPTNNQVNIKKQTASERFNKFLDQIKKTRSDYDFSASTYQMDTNEKPPFNYSQIIGMAMLENGRMTLQQICAWIEEKFAYYRIRKNWNNSIRHNLSLQFCFRKIDRKKYEKGKGGYWELAMDIAKSERKRIRNRKTKKFTNNENGRNNVINHNHKNYVHQQRAPPQKFQNQQNSIGLSQIIENVNSNDNITTNNIKTTENIIFTIKENNIINDETTEKVFNEIISNNDENLNDMNLTQTTFNELINKVSHTKQQNLHNIHNEHTDNDNNNDDNNNNNFRRHKNQTIQMEINLDGELVPINNNSNENCSQNIIKIKINDKLKHINNNNEKMNNSNVELDDIFMVANNKNNNNNINNNNYNKSNNINLNCDTEEIMNFLNETGSLNICQKNDNHLITLSSSKDQQRNHHHNQEQEEIFEDEFQPGTIVDPTTMEIQQQLQQQIYLTNNNVIETSSQQQHEQITSAENIVVSSFLNDNSPIIGPNVIVQQLPYYTIPVMDVITSTTRTVTSTRCYNCTDNHNSHLCSNNNNCSQQISQHQNNINTDITDNDIDSDDINNDIIENQFRPYIDGIDEAFQFLRNSEHRSDELLDGLYDISVGDF